MVEQFFRDEYLKRHATVENAMRFSAFLCGDSWEKSFEREVFDDSEHMEIMRNAVKEVLAINYAPATANIERVAERYCLLYKDSFAEWLNTQK